MKRFFIFLTALAMVFGFSIQAQALLSLRGTGTSVHGTYNLIYDHDLNITWYDYTKSFDHAWQNQVNWADALSVTFGGNVYDDWRLPVTFNNNCIEFNCTNSEMGHLYYTELGNLAGGPLSNTGDFQNLLAVSYWSGTEITANSGNAWIFSFLSGYQELSGMGVSFSYALAVRDGDVAAAAVPEPSTMLLMGSGLAGLVAFRKRFGRIHS